MTRPHIGHAVAALLRIAAQRNAQIKQAREVIRAPKATRAALAAAVEVLADSPDFVDREQAKALKERMGL